jgi:N-acetylglucosaminyldiphosphoundecaprenol N-acetyl-beta-D-mannosaminyltransferase
MLKLRYPDLKVAGADSPPMGFDTRIEEVEAAADKMALAAPDIVYVGLGFPKQERMIARFAPLLPSAWFVACGAAIPFAAGAVPRAPEWMQRAGLEWAYRLRTEPRRLFPRYVVHDLPFAAGLFAAIARQRWARRGG